MVTVAYRSGLLFQSGAGEIWPRKPPPLSGEQSDKKQKSEKAKSKNWMKNPETLMHWCLFERLNRLTKVFKVCPFEYQSDNKQKSEKKKNRRKKCYSDTLGPYNGVQAGLIKGAGTFHSTSQRKEGILVLALPSIRFS